MKATPLVRKTALKAGTPLARRTPLKARSKKTARLYVERRKLVADLLAERPVCERCKAAASTDVHEPKLRSRGGDICDRANCVCLCRPCHDAIHADPAAATAEGWMVHAWDRGAA